MIYMIDVQLLKLCKELSLLWKQKYLMLKEEAEFVIENNIKDEIRIERILDNLLELCEDEKALLLYRKVCRYYYSINPIATVDYINFYKEWYDQDTLNFGKSHKEVRFNERDIY